MNLHRQNMTVYFFVRTNIRNYKNNELQLKPLYWKSEGHMQGVQGGTGEKTSLERKYENVESIFLMIESRSPLVLYLQNAIYSKNRNNER